MNAKTILVVPVAPRSLNQERGEHWSENALTTREVREHAGWAARAAKTPRFEHVTRITVQPYQMGRLQDAGNCYPTAKAIIDGIVDVGVLPDDDPDHLDGITLLKPKIGEPRVELLIAGRLAAHQSSLTTPGRIR